MTWRRDGNSTRHSSQATPCCQLPATSTRTHSRRRRLSTMAGLPRCWPVTSDDPRGQAPSRPPCDWPHHWREVLLLIVSRRWWKHFLQIQFSNYPTVLGCSVHLNVALVVEQTENKNNSKIGRIKYACKWFNSTKLPNFIYFYTTINVINVPGCSVHLNVALVVEQTGNKIKNRKNKICQQMI